MFIGEYDYDLDMQVKAEEAKHNTEWKRQYMEWERQLAYKFDAGKQEGITVGAQQKAIEAAFNFLKMKVLSPEQISQGTGLPIEKVLELQNQLTEI